MKRKKTKATCPCGGTTRGQRYETCCAPFHQGKDTPPDAEALMRSRYSAFQKREAAYLWQTLHSSHDDRVAEGATEETWLARFVAGEEKHSRQYVGLRVVDTAPPDEQGVARVLFVVRVRERGSVSSFAELSFFAEEDGGWRYIAGVLMDPDKATSIKDLE